MAAPPTVLDLVERFDRNRDAYKSPTYNETQLRRPGYGSRCQTRVNVILWTVMEPQSNKTARVNI